MACLLMECLPTGGGHRPPAWGSQYQDTLLAKETRWRHNRLNNTLG
jgi:hypothetical protein